MKHVIANLLKYPALFCALIAPIASQAGIITNGDFESGNTGFTSGYTYIPSASVTSAGVYTVDTNPRDRHPSFVSMGDHTSGTGNMMIVNGASTTGINVWSGTSSLALVVGQQYDFSAWVASVYPTSPAVLTFSVGSASGTISATAAVGTWDRLFFSFVAEEANPFFILKNSNSAFSGNDFAIDDIDIFVAGTTTNPTPPSHGVPDSGATVSLLLVGLAGLGAFSHRRLFA